MHNKEYSLMLLLATISIALIVGILADNFLIDITKRERFNETLNTKNQLNGEQQTTTK